MSSLTPDRVRPHTGRVPELDGLRGVAVLAVVWSHAYNGVVRDERLFPGAGGVSAGGFMGVQLFFVLSGFFITSLLMREFDANGTVVFRRFYARRAHRLLPALALVLVSYGVFVLAVRRGADLRAGLGSIGRSIYLEDLDPLIGRIPSDGYLGHTWSLAVEEQFYLVWPIVFLAVSRLGVSIRRAAIVGLIVVTVVARQLMSNAGLQIYETMHWDALMSGCLLAVMRASPVASALPAGSAGPAGLAGPVAPAGPAGPALPETKRVLLGRLRVRAMRWVTWAAAVVFVAMTARSPDISTTLLFLVSGAVGLAMVAGATDMAWLRWAPLRYFGRISYGLYLWHVLILHFGWPVLPSVALSVLIADLSFRFVEQRFLAPHTAAP